MDYSELRKPPEGVGDSINFQQLVSRLEKKEISDADIDGFLSRVSNAEQRRVFDRYAGAIKRWVVLLSQLSETERMALNQYIRDTQNPNVLDVSKAEYSQVVEAATCLNLLLGPEGNILN